MTDKELKVGSYIQGCIENKPIYHLSVSTIVYEVFYAKFRLRETSVGGAKPKNI